ncbi:hypothetical protein [Streptomyces sp. NPDC059389]|uniref:hypothetical protein n=1 Tax=Streptomyces sp. NPDC059389 TaxID=3346818 RepID=UPI0036AD60B8
MLDTRKAALGVVAVGTLAASVLLGAPAGAATGPAADATARYASFEGRTLDLSGDWGEARVCMVWQGRGAVECFRTASEQEARAAQLRATATTRQVLAACSTPLDLYQYTGKGGRDLKFYDRGYWQNLSAYNFDNSTSSYWTGACTAHLAENPGGGGYWYPGNTGPNHIEDSMRSGWDNRVSSIKID